MKIILFCDGSCQPSFMTILVIYILGAFDIKCKGFILIQNIFPWSVIENRKYNALCPFGNIVKIVSHEVFG